MKKQQLLNILAKKARTFKFEDAAKISNLDSKSLKVMLSRMEKEGLIERIEKGKYLIIPLGAEKGGYTLNEFVIGSQLIEPAVMAYRSALNYHGLTEQIPNTVFIQTTSRKKVQQFESLGVKYRIVRVNIKKFFGIIQLQNDIDIDKLKKYAIDIGNSAVIKRLGLLCDKMGISIDIDPGDLSSNYPLLEPSLHRKGKINSKWKIYENTSDYKGASEYIKIKDAKNWEYGKATIDFMIIPASGGASPGSPLGLGVATPSAVTRSRTKMITIVH